MRIIADIVAPAKSSTPFPSRRKLRGEEGPCAVGSEARVRRGAWSAVRWKPDLGAGQSPRGLRPQTPERVAAKGWASRGIEGVLASDFNFNLP